jgi:carboxyl-terminal processing protease
MKKPFGKISVWVLSLTLFVVSAGFVTKVSDNYFEISKNLDIFGKLYREINSFYVEETDPSKLMRTGIKAMLGSLDPYTTFVGEEGIEDFRFMSTGQYGGIGALIGKRDGRIVVTEPYEGYPADQAGLKAGDQIIAVDGKQVAGTEKEVIDIRDLLRGEQGTSVVLTVKRKGEEGPLELTVKRDRIKIRNVPYFGVTDENIGYIALTGFTQDAGKEVQEALKEMMKDHPLKGVILDLRDNPGGRLDESVNVANAFLSKGEKIVETRGRMEDSYRSYEAKQAPVAADLPLTVLINGRSASASEIVAGAIQDFDRGLIIGERSFGKGLVQNIRNLAYNTQLKVTTAKYYTPSGRCIQAIDYAERDEYGRVRRIPDSLQNEFTTRNGRKVYDGGGIEPDILIDEADMNLVSRELLRQGVIFDFVTGFVAEHPSIAGPGEFVVDEDLYQQFIDYAKARNFSYETPADQQLEVLSEVLEEEAYDQHLSDELASLKVRLNRSKEKDFQTYREEISWALQEELLRRYYYEAGVRQAALNHDPEVLQAINLLGDKDAYAKALSAPKP